jgi:hypothetical protein
MAVAAIMAANLAAVAGFAIDDGIFGRSIGLDL